jgi:putative flavoprotein involved in K+ transport
MTESNATRIANMWLSKLGAAVERQDISAVVGLFGDECYWRDLVSLTWNIKTAEGRKAVGQMLASVLPQTRMSNLGLLGDSAQSGDTIEAWFTFQTVVARGKGHLRLKDGKGFTILTTMTELIGHEEQTGPTPTTASCSASRNFARPSATTTGH